MQQSTDRPHGRNYLATTALGALGVVYGDIGTSPIYSVREALHAANPSGLPTRFDILGILSLIFWALTIVVSIKYLIFVLEADNYGEGGILALTTLVNRAMPKHRRDVMFLMLMGLFGTALLYGDGMITPAISVLSAVEGLETVTPAFTPYVIPITVTILVALFSIQRNGTDRVGKLFGPIMLVWFVTLGWIGTIHIIKDPAILHAVLPKYGIEFLLRNGATGFVVLGSVFLVVTGGEALYADLGHFGKDPIRLAWFILVLPALMLDYFGQGAMLLGHPAAASDPFFLVAPRWALLPLVLLSTAATVIASQALISGTYSLTMQAVQLKYLPRVHVEHTSEREHGQIYVASVNWALMVACVLLVITFQTSSALAAAYGVAVTLTMVITTCLLYYYLRHNSGWGRLRAGLLCGFFLSIELTFFAGNIDKIPHGGWFPLAVGGLTYLTMSTWRLGRKRLAALRAESGIPLETLAQNLDCENLVRVSGTAVFMHADPTRVPAALLHNIRHNQVLHTRNLIVTVIIEDHPHVPRSEITSVEDLGESFYRVQCRFGYMDRHDVPDALRGVVIDNEPLNPDRCSYFLGRETILPRHWLWSGMAVWREQIFALMARNAQDATAFFHIPPSNVMEVGSQIEI